ncbi:integrase catalytic domain-containing protein [Trichonephila clavipes]|nr:integrase catalytic domain-containing protein [Trichonephila clavipes]
MEQHVRLFWGTMGAEFLFMDDNAHPHRANIVDECLQSEDITRMDWAAYSPDLNPIEHNINSSMSKEALVVLNRKRGAIKAQLTRIKDFMNNSDEKDKTHLESKLDILKSLRIKLSDIRNEYYEVVADDSDLEPLESEILDLKDDCEDIQIFFEILNNGKIKVADGKLILQDTVFGYVASGVISHNYTNKSYCGLVTNANELNNSIKRFWEIENCPDFEIPTMSREEKLCEEHFTSNYNRDETGRFIVKMPPSKDPSCSGDSKQMALRRLNSLWRRLVQDS